MEQLKAALSEIVETGSALEFQLEYNNQGNYSRHLFVKASFLDGKLVNKRILLVITEVTDKVKSQQQRDALIAFVIHELRNPLSSISLCNTLLAESLHDNDKEGGLQYVQQSNKSVERLKSLIQEMYEATMAGAGNLTFKKTSFNFNNLVAEVVEGIQMTSTQHTIHKTGEANIDIFADRDRIHQTLSNYLLNAIKYSPNADKVDLHIAIESGSVIVAVTDYGPGIPEDKIPRIFDRYYRADETKKIEGLGLGLFLCKQIIDGHDGRVWIKSKENEGSTFYFAIPIQQ